MTKKKLKNQFTRKIYLHKLFDSFKQSSINRIITVLALVFLILSTKLFPWNFVQNYLPILKEIFQMPRRFVILFIPLYLVGVGISAEKISVKSTKISMAVYAILGIVFLSNFNNTTRLNNFYTINSLMLAKHVKPHYQA